MRTLQSTRISTLQPNRAAIAASPVAAFLSRALFGVAACVIAVASCLAEQTQPQPSLHVVVIKQMRFQPSTLNVKAGDRVEWKNEDIFSHTVTANDGSFNSGLIAPGSSWQTAINKTGTIAYHCRPHPNMTAELVVEQAEGDGQHDHGGAQGEQGGQVSLRWSPPPET